MTTSNAPEKTAGTAEEDSGAQMTFFEHLVELRKRIINSLIAIAIGAFAGVYAAYASPRFIEFVTRPMLKALADAHLEPSLMYMHPTVYLVLVIRIGGFRWLGLGRLVVRFRICLFVAP